MKEILILSGKGGTGKTTFTAAFSFFIENNDILVDCDVDAADLHILLQPDKKEKFAFYSGKECEVVKNKCTSCGICVDNCHYNAISIDKDSAVIDQLECEKCLLCYQLCPENAIEVKDAHCGEYFISNTKHQKTLVHAELYPGADNSGKLVSTIRILAKNIANKKKSNIILIDGPPGIGCPVIAAVTGVNYVIFITEPTLSGVSDLERITELIQHFKINCGCIINKSTINQQLTERIKKFCNSNNIEILGEIPYEKKFYEAITQKKSIIEIDEKLYQQMKNIWEKI